MPITVSQDINDIVEEYSKKWLEPKEAPMGLFDLVGRGEKLSKTGKWEWWERLRRPRVGAVGTDYTAGDGVIVVADVLPFFQNAIIKLSTGVFRVTAINETTKTLTVALVSGVDPATAVATTQIKVVSNANVEGGVGSANSRNPEKIRYNTTQILYDVFSMSVSSFESDQKVGGREYLKQVSDKMAQYRNDVRGMLWSDVYVEATSSDIAPIAGGVPKYVAENGYTDTGAINHDNLTAFIRAIYDEKGGVPLELWVNPTDADTISDLDASQFNRDANNTQRGVSVNTYKTKDGIVLDIMRDPKIEQGKLYALNSKDVQIRPFRDLKVEPLAKTGDFYNFEVVAELSLEVNPSSQMGVFTVS